MTTSAAEQWKGAGLWRLLVPLIVEQVFGVTIGIADTLMVASVGEHAVSGVSLVDSINVLLIIAFGALATGGSVVVSQYIGRRDERRSRTASLQLMYVTTAVSLLLMVCTLLLASPILRLVYGRISPAVMDAAKTYFMLSALSYPFLAVYNAAASLYRSMGNSRVSMLISLLVNLVNISGNAVLIFGLGLGVLGAGISTLVSRAVAALVLFVMLVSDVYSPVSLAGVFKIRLDGAVIRSILNVGIPSGVESSVFQVGKILVSRIFTTFGTAAIAANAVSSAINSMMSMPAGAFGIGMMTIIGQCVGAKDFQSARMYASKLLKLAHLLVTGLSALIIIFLEPMLRAFNLSGEAREIARVIMWASCIFSPIAWAPSFVMPNALRAAGDANFVMIVAVISMWTVRVSAAYLLAYTAGMGPAGVWFAMIADWFVRGALYLWRWKQGAWEHKNAL
jgi:putative MATE family efflux protein